MTASTESKVTFYPLPYKLRRDIDGGCQCSYCKAHPHQTPQWDTMAHDRVSDYTWVVHYPERRTQSPS